MNINFFKLILINLFLFFSINAFSYELLITGIKKLSIQDLQSMTSVDLEKLSYNASDLEIITNDLYKNDLIYDYTLNFKDDIAHLNLVESKIIENIYLNNNINIEDEFIFNQISSKKEMLLNKSLISKDINKISNLYEMKGYASSYITSSVESYSIDRVNLIFTIHEGSPSRITNIDFIGNKFFSDGFLNDLIISESISFLNFFKKGSNLDESIFNFDKNKINSIYKKYGFFDAKVTYELKPKRNNTFQLNFIIEENKQLDIENIQLDLISNDFAEDFNFLIDEFNNEISRNNNKYNESLILKYLDLFDNLLSSNNLLNSKFEYEAYRSGEKINLKFSEKKLPLISVNKIDILGNSITKDKTIRSKLLFEPGDLLNENQIKRSEDKLKNLKYINKIDITSIDNNNVVDISIKVDENKKTGNLLFGGSFSGDTGFGLAFNVKDFNFMGSGNEIDSSFNINSEKTLFDISYIQHPIDSPNIKNKFKIFNSETDYTSSFGFKSKKYGIGYNILFDYNKDIKISSGIKLFNENNYSAVKSITAINDNIGNHDSLELNFSLIRDTTNDILYPTDGTYNKLNFSYVPDDISDNPHYKFIIKNNSYKQFDRNDSFVFLLNNFGYADSLNNNLKTVDTFSLGGSNFKGFDYRGIGPFQDGIYLGGNNIFTSTVGYGDNFIFDEKDNIIMKVFYSTGSIWGSDYTNDKFELRSSVGLSFDILASIPISLNYAIPIEKETSDKTRSFNFYIGTSF